MTPLNSTPAVIDHHATASEASSVNSASTITDAPQPPATIRRHASNKSFLSWTLVNFWLDSLMLLNFVAIVLVACIIQFVFPPVMAADGWTLWGMNLNGWMGLQFGLIAIFTLGIMVHLMLHWSWVCGVFFGRIWKHRGKKSSLPDDGTRTIYGVGLMIGILHLLGAVIAAAALTIQSPL